MRILKIIYKFGVTALMLYFMLIPNSKAQTILSQDPIYHLVFEDNFSSTDLDTTNNWYSQYYGFQCNQYDSSKTNTKINGIYYDVDQDYNFLGNPDTNFIFHTSGSGTGDGYTSLVTKHHATPLIEPIWRWGHKLPPHQNEDSTWTENNSFKFTTATLFGKHNFKYCYIEMSFRTNNYDTSRYNAYSPNFWMWGSDTTATYSEIDISEMEGIKWTTAPCSHYKHFPNKDSTGFIPPPTGYGADDTAYWHANDFWDTSTYVPYQRHHTPVNTPFTPGNWHTIGCEWTPDYIDIYYYTLSADTFQRFSANKFPVSQLCAMPIIIDNYTPAPRDTFFIPFDTIHTRMPFNYDIDYVRVYQVKQHCIPKTFVNTSSATYADTLWQNLTIGGSGSTGAKFTSGNHHLAGNDYVLLQEGFEVSNGATVLINTMSCQSDQSKSSAQAPSNPPKPLTLQQKTDILNKRHNE